MASSRHPQAAITNLQIGARVALFGMIVNLIFAVAKILGGLLGNAYVLIADGIESALDIAGSFIIWGGLKLASRPPDETHPYGHGKAEPIAAIIVSVGVLAAAFGLAVQSVREIFLPHHAPARFTLIIVVVVVTAKELLFRYVDRLNRHVRSTAVQTDALHHRSDAIISAAAFVGLSLALIGGPRWQSADDWAALFACAVIGANGWRLLRPAFYEIMDTAPRDGIADSVRIAAQSVPGVVRIDKCLVRKMGLDFYVDIHVQVNGAISVFEGHTIAHRVKDVIRATNERIADVLVHIEPAER